MQHYGLPTRLLDWTSSYLVALFFAVQDLAAVSTPAVWVIRAASLNAAVCGEVTIATEEHPVLSDYLLGKPSERHRRVSGRFAVGIRPEMNSDRLVAQRGGFTLHGFRPIGLESLCDELDAGRSKPIPLTKIEIDPAHRVSIYRELINAGISHSTIFPEVAGIAAELKLKYSETFVAGTDIASLN